MMPHHSLLREGNDLIMPTSCLQGRRHVSNLEPLPPDIPSSPLILLPSLSRTVIVVVKVVVVVAVVAVAVAVAVPVAVAVLVEVVVVLVVVSSVVVVMTHPCSLTNRTGK